MRSHGKDIKGATLSRGSLRRSSEDLIMTISISHLAERLGCLRRRRAAIHSLLMSLSDGSFDSSEGQAALSSDSDQMEETLDEMAGVESELEVLEEQYRRLQWEQH